MHLHFAPPTLPARFASSLVALALILSPMRLLGQAQNTGQLTGTVTDQTHSVIPGALVTLLSDDRGTIQKSPTNSAGAYSFNDLEIGTYTVTVTASGFASFVTHHVVIDADTHFRVDAEMKPGEVSAEVDVTANTAGVDTQSATIAQVIDNQLVENLPIDGNNIVQLAAILPGVTDVTAPTTFTDENGGATLSANGARSNSNLFLFDGLLWNNLYLNTGINYPNHAVIAQVSVQLNNFSAQYGRNAGSIFNVVSKGGTNTIHGQLFLSDENAIFNAQNYFQSVKPPQNTYQFGGAVGGPIIRDKLFFELEYQGLTGVSSVAANAETFTNAERGLNSNGTPRACVTPAFAALGGTCADFGGDLRSGSAISGLLYNPIISTSTSAFGTNPSVAESQLQSTWLATGHSGTNPCITVLQSYGQANIYSGNTAEIPSVCFDPVIQNVIRRGYIPTPSLVQNGIQYSYAVAETPRPQVEDGGFARVDWTVNTRHTLELRYYKTNNGDLTANGGGSATTGVPSYEIDANSAYITAGSIGDTFVASPNMVNAVKVGYKRYDYEVIPTDPTNLAALGSTFSYPGYQSLPIINVNTRFTLGNAAEAYTHSVNQNIEAFDNLSIVRGRHNLVVGADWLRSQYLKLRANTGSFNFYGNPGYTNLQAADAIMGLLYSESVGNTQNIAAVQHALYSYVQDTWRATPRLTVNLGVRYEIPWSWYQPQGKAATFIRGYQSTVFPNAPTNEAFVGDPGVPRGLTPTDYLNISPRVGLAYDVFGNGKTAIRAGFGTFYDAIPATIVGATEPYTYSAFYQNPNGSITNPLLGETAIPAPYSSGTAIFTKPYSIIYPDRNFKDSYTIGVNFGFQQQIRSSGVLEANYIGRYSRHEMIPLDQNPAIVDCSGAYFQANPTLYCDGGNFTQIVGYGSNATTGYPARVVFPNYNYGGQGVVDLISEASANYNAFQISYRQHSLKNLTVLTNYTLARSLDQQTSLSVSNSTPTPQDIALQYAPSDLNSAQVFNLGFTLRTPKVTSTHRWVRATLDDWSINGIYNARTGHPVNLTFGGDESGTDEPNQRALIIPGDQPLLPTNRHRVAKIQQWWNPNAFEKALPGTFSPLSRNWITGPAYISANLSAMRTVSLAHFREGMRAQFRVESFNLFNTVNLGQPNSTYSASSGQTTTFGTITSGGSNENRRIQLGLIIYF